MSDTLTTLMNWCLSLLHKSLGSQRKWPQFQGEGPLHCVWRLIHLYICEAMVCLSEACFQSASVDGDWRHAEPEEIQPRWPQEWKGQMLKIFKSKATNRRYSCLTLQWIRIADISSLNCCGGAIFKISHLKCFLTVLTNWGTKCSLRYFKPVCVCAKTGSYC